VTYTYYEGQYILLTASPSGTSYTYDWSADPAITRVAGTDAWVFAFYAPSVTEKKVYEISVVQRPTGAPESCKSACIVTVNVLPRASLGYFVWDDLNGDGIQDPGEPGIGGVTVELINTTTGLVVDTKITDAAGYYLFTEILPGDYTVKFYPPAGYHFSPQNAGGDDALDSDPNTATGETGTINLASGESDLTVDAGLVYLCISGYKLDNCDGEIPGWAITLSNSTYTTSKTTDGNGYYEFCALAPGPYTVKEAAKPGWSPVSPQTIGLDLSFNSISNANFTNQELLCASGYLLDKCTNKGLAGRTITLTNASYTSSTTTDSSGYYVFCGLLPGTYTVKETAKEGWSPITQQLVFELICNNITNQNLTDQKLLCISGFKLNSSDGVGLRDWLITLTNGSYSASTPTDDSGKYEFCGLAPGDYNLNEEIVPGWLSIEVPSAVRLICENVTYQNFTNLKVQGSISIKKYTNGEDANDPPGPDIPVGNAVTWTYEVTNIGNVNLTDVQVTDDIIGLIGTIALLQPGESQTLTATGTALSGQYANMGNATGTTPIGTKVSAEDPSHYNGESGCVLDLTKTALNETVERGQDIYYNIGLCNPCDYGFTNVTVWDVLPNDVQLVSVDPPASLTGNKLTWDLGTFPSSPYQRCFNAVVVVRVPVVNMSYDMEQGVQGEGFVNVHNDYDTHHEPKSLTNCAYAKADLMETISSCASTRVVDPGTELRRREFGSGTYASEELTRVRTENKSIQSATSLSATHKPTTFSLPGGSSITYGSKWTEKSKGLNYATGATMNEEYTFANKIDKERVVDLDKNGSTMKTDVSFTGTGHIGVLKKEEPDSHPKIDPLYEGVEDYVGSFKVYEMVDEYGKNVRSEKGVTGYGYVAVDKRVSDNQRTYESGTGSYQSDEKIETASNYIAKDISLVHGPTNYSYTPSFATNQNIKWSEGMWSKSGVLAGGTILAALPTSGCGGEAPANTSAPASYISERYSSLDYLDKETVAAGLNEMRTNASFSGMADFRAKATYSNKTGEIDNEERYVGEYDITRKVQITGVSKYGRPHITVTKEGNMTTRWFNKTMANVAEYTITIVNDGNVALAPINIRDIFPPGTEYIYSSIRPESYTNSEANWSLMNLGVGNSIQLELTLNVTRYAPANLVNRVMVCGINGLEGCVSGSAYFVLESGDLSCCPPEVVLDKIAEIDSKDPTLIHYTIVVKNTANSTVAATLTDMLPVGLTYISASNQPDRQEGQFLEWIVPDLEKGDVFTIEYQAKASMDGTYVNEVHMDSTAVDGTGYDTEDAAARVYIGSTGVAPRTTRYGGWQVPDWNMTSSEQGITVSLSPDEDSAAEFPTMYS